MNEDTQEIFEAQVYEEVLIQEDTSASSQRTPLLEKTIFWFLLSVVFLLPVFFLPVGGILPGFSKTLLLSVTGISATILMLLFWLQKGTLTLPKSKIFAVLSFIVLFSTFSSLMSSSFSASFFGGGAEITASFEFLVLAVLVFLFAVFFRNKERIFSALAAVFVSAIAVFIFQIFHLIFPDLTTFMNFPADKAANLIGSWSDFGIFAGMIGILSLVALEMMPNKGRRVHRALFIVLALALFFHLLALYTYSWVIMAVAGFALAAFTFFKKMSQAEFPMNEFGVAQAQLASASFAIALLSAVFIFTGPALNAKIFEVLKIPPVQDVRPSWTGTYQTALGALTPIGKETFIGVGPNKFFVSWQQYRPKEVNYTPWWTIDFNEGIGTIPSFLATSGVLGFLGWIILLLVFLVGGFIAVRKIIDRMTPFVQYLAVSTFAAASYLWIAAFTNAVGVVPFAFAFIFTGIFLGLLSGEGIPIVHDYQYLRNPKKGFLLATILLIMAGASALFGYEVFAKYRSIFVYRTALIAAYVGDNKKAETEFINAFRLHESDIYYRTFSTFHSYRLEQLVVRKDISPDDLREQFGVLFRTSIESANKAIEMDRANYLNWMSLGNAYAVLVPLGIENLSNEAYTQSKEAYEQAARRNPFNPQIPYLLAQLSAASNHPEETKGYLQRSLELKNDYTDALVFLSQVEESGGRTAEALAVIESAPVDLSEPRMLFQLGYLRYKNGKYQEAASALEKVLRFIPDYSNAKYFLGLSYFETGRNDDALREFSDIERLNPGRDDIMQIIRNLQNGYAPLSSPVPQEVPPLPDLSAAAAQESASKNR
ncbi:MAG: tetratricopeptide repeat protein [Parcubacteria group bacterium]|nr:tetratricopeptide repeat protein [Parcubacteria group bacterium]